VDVTEGVVARGLGSRGGRPVETIRVDFVKGVWDGLVKDVEVPTEEKVSLIFGLAILPSPVLPTNKDFIITIPDGNRWMISESSYIVYGLCFDIIQIRCCAWIHGTSKHHIMPDKHPLLIAYVIEYVILILPATP